MQRPADGLLDPVKYEPVRCQGCRAVLNPYCSVDFMSKLWTCPFCLTRNKFSKHYADNITEKNQPAELIPAYSTLEYELPNLAGPPVFVFVIDTSITREELDALKDSIQQSLNLLPEDALVGFITFGKMVHVHELGFTDCPKAYVFSSRKEFKVSQVKHLLGLDQTGSQGMQGMPGVPPTGMPPNGTPQAGAAAAYGHQPQQGGGPGGSSARRFLLPVSECGYALECILDDLDVDPWDVKPNMRRDRCTGVAIAVAIGMVSATHSGQGARVMLFVGGPATVGQGRTADTDLSNVMRSHTDIKKDVNTKYMRGAMKYYNELAQICVRNHHVVDIFACNLDQVGLLEMKSLATKTGGLIILADFFKQSVFKESFRRVFKRFPEKGANNAAANGAGGGAGGATDANGAVNGGGPVADSDAGNLMMAFAANIQIMTSSEFKVQGAIGPCSSLQHAGKCVSQDKIGEGGTDKWSCGGLMPSTTLGFYFEIVNSHDNPLPPGRLFYIQLLTTYQHASGKYRLRVTTLAGPWHSNPEDKIPVSLSFDQEAAAVLVARLASHRLDSGDEHDDVLRWIDRSLIRLTSKFAEYMKEQPESLRFEQAFNIYPQFMFHLRRSQFIHVFNSSPDETAFARHTLLGENTSNGLVMIQPSLLAYSFKGPPVPVLLDAKSIQPDTILLLDTFFHVVICHGETIVAWREANYQNNPEYASFKALLQAPQDDALVIMESRYPVPRYIVCDQGKSQARFLLAKLNPSVTHNSMGGGGTTAVFTDDVSLNVFMEHLCKLAVQN